jgi:hypothetical protein
MNIASVSDPYSCPVFNMWVELATVVQQNKIGAEEFIIESQNSGFL